MLKSDVGPFPEPRFPRGINLGAEDRKARHRLYPVTILYPAYFVLLLTLAVRSSHTVRALGFVGLGAVGWTLAEYLVHRHVLHGVFPRRKGLLSRCLHYMFDGSHSNHHSRPWDGRHINGHLDTLYAAAVFIPLSLLAPAASASVWVATIFLCYTMEEWAHHAMHFWNFEWAYFRYVRGRHLYHHSRHGVGIAYGITTAFWDTALGTPIPMRQQDLLPRIGGFVVSPREVPVRSRDLSAHA
jgi:cyclopropane-fatty-acyl-phospholipid synthase